MTEIRCPGCLDPREPHYGGRGPLCQACHETHTENTAELVCRMCKARAVLDAEIIGIQAKANHPEWM